jgi:toxin ParE1/3/4
MKVLYAQSFGADLDEITKFIAADNPARAVSFVEEIRWVCTNVIAAHPRLGRLRPEFGRAMRSLATHNRTIFYTFDADADLLKFYRVIGRQGISTASFED